MAENQHLKVRVFLHYGVGVINIPKMGSLNLSKLYKAGY